MSSRSIEASSECATMLKAMAVGTRLAVLERLLSGPCRVSELLAELELDQSLLSHHLRVLRDAGLVVPTREGKSVLYGLAPRIGVRGRTPALDLGCCRITFRSESG